MGPAFEFNLLEHQVFIASIPSIIPENNGTLELFFSGKVPSVEDVQELLAALGREGRGR